MDQETQGFDEYREFLPEDFTPPADWLKRMKVTWPEFVELFGGVFYETEGERLDQLCEAAGIT
jgi:hypothetical protein